MPEVLAAGNGWVFAASTLSDGDMFFPSRQPGETEAAFSIRESGLFERLHAVFRDVLPPALSFHVAKLCHGNAVEIVTQGDVPMFYDNTDGLATSLSRVVLRVTGADCPPVLLVDEHGHRIALVHSGRKGTLLNIVREAVRQLAAMGSAPASLRAIVGPGICGECYEVSSDIARDFAVSYPNAVNGRNIDLRSALHTQLECEGILAGNIGDIMECTCEMGKKWFSYRRDVRSGLKSDTLRVQSFVALLV